MNLQDKAWEQILENYIPSVGLRAGAKDSIHPDIWARDAFISCFFMLNSKYLANENNSEKLKVIVKQTLTLFLENIQDDRVPLRIQDNKFTHTRAIFTNIWNNIPLLRNILPLSIPKLWNMTRPVYKSSQIFSDYPVDPALWLTIVFFLYCDKFVDNVFRSKNIGVLEKVINRFYINGEVIDHLLAEGQLANWMDSFRYSFPTYVSYSNILLLKVLELLAPVNSEWLDRHKQTKDAINKNLIIDGMLIYGKRNKEINSVPADSNFMAAMWFPDLINFEKIITLFESNKMYDPPVRAFLKPSLELVLRALLNFPSIYHLNYSWPWLSGLAILACRKHKAEKFEKIISSNFLKICDINNGFPEVVRDNYDLVKFGPFHMSNDNTWTVAAALVI